MDPMKANATRWFDRTGLFSRRGRSWVLIFVGTFLASSLRAGSEPRLRKADPFLLYWAQFRRNVMEEDWEKLSFLVQFPLATERGPRPKEQFGGLIPRVLDAQIPGGDYPTTTRALITEKSQLTDEDWETIRGESFEIGRLHFAKVNGRWALTRLGAPPAPAAPPPSEEPMEEAPADTPVVETAPEPPPAPPVAPRAATPAPVPPPATPKAAPTVPAAPPKAPPPVVSTPVQKPAPTPEPAAPLSPPAATPGDPDFAVFWADFRLAVMYKDMDSLKKLTRFPFETKGRLEEDPVVKRSARDFEGLYARMMETDPGKSPMKDSMRELVSRVEYPREGANSERGEVQVGIFVFTKVKGKWLFTRATLER